MKKYSLCIFLFLTAVLLIGCRADISAYADTPILVTGLPSGDRTVTPAELAELDCTSATAVGKSAKAGTVNAWGPTLETFLAFCGVSLDEVRYVRFYAGDGYSVSVGAKVWDKYPVILSVANGNRPLEEGQQPLRVVIPDGPSSNWVRFVTEIAVTMEETP